MGSPVGNVAAYIRGMSFEEREAVVMNWEYDRSRANRTIFDTSECKRRHAEVIYLGHYNVDNLYELCVFKNFIYILNKAYGKMSPSDQVHKGGFTLGHWVPAGRGGAHLPSNWFVQKAIENFNSGDKILPEPEKFDFYKQLTEILLVTCEYTIDRDYAEQLHFYLNKLREVY